MNIIFLTYIPMNSITCSPLVPVMDTHKDAICIAAAKLGFADLKSHQLEVILAFITGNDVFAVLPTGYGKSLCYACLPIIFDHLLGIPQGDPQSIVIVVSPLTAIIEDQVLQMWQ